MNKKTLLILLSVAVLCVGVFGAVKLVKRNVSSADAEPVAIRPQSHVIDPEAWENAEDVSEFSVEPYVPDSLDRVIIGTDDRIDVNDPGCYPYSATAYMRVKAQCGCTWEGSGFMVSRRGLVTAAHCLVCTKHYAGAERIDLYFGYQTDHNYLYKTSAVKTYWYGTDFSSTGGYNIENDYAYILLGEPVGDHTGWLGMRALSDTELRNTCFWVDGYRDGQIKYALGYADINSENTISYEMDTVPGYSGGPVSMCVNYDDFYAVAINVAESTFPLKNYGWRIPQWLIDYMYTCHIFDS